MTKEFSTIEIGAEGIELSCRPAPDFSKNRTNYFTTAICANGKAS